MVSLSVFQKCSMMYETNYDGPTSYVSNYFYCYIRWDAECNLLAIAKFVIQTVIINCRINLRKYSSNPA